MLYLHDVWVNWFEGEENGYNVCHFYEWRKDDAIELLDQVPVLKVSPQLFYYLENSLSEIPKPLLEDVYQKAYVRKIMSASSLIIVLLRQMVVALWQLIRLAIIFRFEKAGSFHAKNSSFMRWSKNKMCAYIHFNKVKRISYFIAASCIDERINAQRAAIEATIIYGA